MLRLQDIPKFKEGKGLGTQNGGKFGESEKGAVNCQLVTEKSGR